MNLDENAIRAIERVLKNGNKAVVQRTKDGVIVMEEKRTIQYRNTMPSRA